MMTKDQVADYRTLSKEAAFYSGADHSTTQRVIFWARQANVWLSDIDRFSIEFSETTKKEWELNKPRSHGILYWILVVVGFCCFCTCGIGSRYANGGSGGGGGGYGDGGGGGDGGGDGGGGY